MSSPRPGLVCRLFAPLGWAWRGFAGAPRALQAAVVLVAVAAVAGGGMYARDRLTRRAHGRAVADGWKAFAEAAKTGDLPGMDSGLAAVLAASPDDQFAARRKADIARRSADPSDPELATVLLQHHLANSRLPEAAREAETVLARTPKDWRARCVVAHAALVRNDRDAATKHLAALPDPDDPDARLDPGGLLYAAKLFALTDRDAAPLRGLVVRRLVPALRGGPAAAAPPAAKAQLVECYLEAFADPAYLPALAGAWAPAARLADRGVAEATDAGDVPALVRFGEAGPRLLAALARVRDHERLPADKSAALAAEVEDRTRRAWEAVRAKEPARPEAHAGLAAVSLRAGKVEEAFRTLTGGLAACGDRVELLDPLADLLARTGNARAAHPLTWAAAERARDDPGKWSLAAAAAEAAGFQDRAIEACGKVRAARPGHPLAAAQEARLWLRAGFPAKALDALRTVDEPRRRSVPLLAALTVRALAETGGGEELDGFLAAADKPAAVAVAALRGLHEADPPAHGRAVEVARRAQGVLRVWPDAPGAARLRADALRRAAELDSPAWQSDAVRAALRAYEETPAREKTDPFAAAAVAVLQLKGLNDPAAADRAAGPVREAVADPAAPFELLEAFSAVERANGRPDGAARALERAAARPGFPAACWVELALARHAAGRPADARDALRRATAAPRSAREQAGYAAAAALIARESP